MLYLHMIQCHFTLYQVVRSAQSHAGLHDTHSDLRCLFNRKELDMQEGPETCRGTGGKPHASSWTSPSLLPKSSATTSCLGRIMSLPRGKLSPE